MEHSNELTQGLNEIKTVANEGSWFRDTPHYWAEASLPLAYAVACVEVVSKRSEPELHSMRARMDTTDTTQAKTVPQMPLALLE